MGDIPEAQGNDHEDVALALEVARAQWAKREPLEALKWLRKAADAAFDAGEDKRGMELSKVFADLNNEVKKKGVPPASPGAGSKAGGEAAPRSLRGKAVEASKGTAAPVSKRGKAFPAVERSTGAKRAQSLKPTPRAEPNPAVPAPPPAASAAWKPEKPTSASRRPLPAGGDDRTSRSVGLGGGAGKTSPTDRPGAPESEIATTQAIRVAVARAPNGRVTVRLLEGKGVFLGEHEAMLVSLTRGDDLSALFK